MAASHALSARPAVALGTKAKHERVRRGIQIVLCSAALALAGIAGAATARLAPESTSPPPTSFLTPTETAVTPADLARERR